MITITIMIPKGVGSSRPAHVVDGIEVSILDDTHDRQPRGTFLEGLDDTDPNHLKLTFAT